MSFLPSELEALRAHQLAPDSMVLVEATVHGIQVAGQGVDQHGNAVLVFAFIAGLPANLLEPKPAILGPDGQPIGGGLAGALPIPPTVRLLVPLEVLSAVHVPQRVIVPTDEARPA